MSSKLSKETIAKLMGPVSPLIVRTRKKGPVELSYVDGSYVVGEMCEILGPDGWSFECTSFEKVEESTNAKGLHVVGYLCQGKITLSGTDVIKGDIGFGQGIDRSLGGAHESATKEAATDCLKRCARQLGWHMGLALYDKAQAHVHQEATTLLSKKKLKVEDKADIVKLKGKLDPEEYDALVAKYKKDVE